MLKLCGLREGDIYGEIYLPLSKSVSNRVLIIKAQLGERPYDGSEFAVCDDTTVMLDALRTIWFGVRNYGETGHTQIEELFCVMLRNDRFISKLFIHISPAFRRSMG